MDLLMDLPLDWPIAYKTIRLAESEFLPLQWVKVLDIGPFIISLFIGLIFGLIFGLLLWWIYGLIIGLIIGLAVGLIYGMIFGLLVELVVGRRPTLFQEMSQRILPNEGVYRSIKNAFFIGLGTGLVGGLVIGLASGLIWGLVNGLLTGLATGLISGGYACIQHYVLRLLLWRDDFAPLRYVRFLDYATDLLFLHKIGGGYMFVHRMVLEHFAALDVHDLAKTDKNTV